MLACPVAEGAALLEDPSAGPDRVVLDRRRSTREARGRHDRRSEQREAREGGEAAPHVTPTWLCA
jgi:hypothetical protein